MVNCYQLKVQLMTDKEETHTTQRKGLAPWLWSLIWSILGILLAILVIFLLAWPFLWLFGRSGGTSSAAGRASLLATQTAIAGTITAEANRGPDDGTGTPTGGPVGNQDEQAAQITPAGQSGGTSTTAASTVEASDNAETSDSDNGDSSGDDLTASPVVDSSADSGGSDNEVTTTQTPIPPPSGPNPPEALAAEAVDVYLGPATTYPIIGSLPANVPLPIIGQNEGNGWWQVIGPDGTIGWIQAGQVTASNTAGVPITAGPQAIADGDLALYLGPSRVYPVVATLPPNTPLAVVGQNESGTWWQVIEPGGTLGWVPDAAVSVANSGGVPLAQAPQLSSDSGLDVYLGPGDLYPIIGNLPANVPLPIIGRNDDDSWWQVSGPDDLIGWVSDENATISDVSDVPVKPGPQVSVTAEEDVYLGPNIAYPIIATLPPNVPLPITGRNQDRTWWQITAPEVGSGWVPDLLVTASDTAAVPVVEAPSLPEPTAEPSALGTTRGGDYIVQRDDWLSKLSDKFYSSPIAYWPIIAATNRANTENPDYARITDADFIEIGDRLLIPSAEEAEAFLTDFDPTEDAASIGLTVVSDVSVTSNITATDSLTLTNSLTDTTGITGTNESN